jgi:hypothetical protein
MTMELDDFKTAWQALDRRGERQELAGADLRRAWGARQARRRLRPLWLGQVVQLLLGVAIIMAAVAFWTARRDNLHLMICGLMLHGYGLLIVLAAGRSFYLLGRIDHAAPVVAIQKRLAALRVWRAKVEGPVFGAIGCFIWIPLVLALFDTFFGADIWARSPAVVGWLVASGVLCLAILLAVVAWSRRPGREGFAAALQASAAGRGIGRAERELADIARFEAE